MTEGSPSSPLYSPLDPLELASLLQIARYRARVAPIPHDSTHPAAMRMTRSAAWVDSTMHEVERASQEGREPTAYYGINTGFGDNAGRATFHHPVDAQRLSRKLLLSHAIGVGQHLSEEIVRAALVLRIWSLCAGYSGVRTIVVNTLIAMLNQDIYPAVPAQGSLGASGDLAPLAHLVLPLSAPMPDEPVDLPSGTGWCYVEGQLISGAEAMTAAGIPQVVLGAKEGVALINGTAVSTGIAALALLEAKQVLAATTIGVALTAEAMLSFRDAFLPHVHRLRSTYQAEAAAAIHALLEGSTLIRGDADVDLPASDGPPQDPYSIRCAPVVIGAARRALEHVESIVVDELSAVTDNPLIFAGSNPADSAEYLPRAAKVISGGNFHGEPIALAMDYLAIAVAELANIAERRTFLLSDSRQNRGLPPFLILDFSGLNNGLMIAQYTAASLVSENKSLAHPASVDSIPSSANREDHVSMSTIAARKALQIVENARQVVAIELLCAAQALSLRLESTPQHHAGRRTTAILGKIRGLEIAAGKPLAVIRQDVPLAPYVAALAKAIRDGILTSG